MRKALGICILFLLVLFSVEVKGQCGTGTSAIYTIDFSAAKDTTWTLNASRNGTACVGTSGEDDRCIRFNVSLNPGSDLLNFDADQLTGASFYSINCGPLIPIGTPACITGLTSVCISFCKPGGNKVNYTVTASSIIKGSADLVLRQNCSGTMSVTGVTASTVNWRSVFPGASNAYNSYLSATSNVTTVTVTPLTGAPSFIDYEVSGTGACTGLRRDTIRVYTVSPMTVAINPATPALCNGASVTLNATVSGGNPPYLYTWNTGSTATGITVSTVGNYSVSVADNTVGCPNEVGNATVIAAATPAVPTVPAVSVCSGSPATLTVSSPPPSSVHEWFTVASGGTAIATGNSYTTGTLTANTTYYVQTTVNGCTSTRTAVTVTVNAIPTAPTASGTTICAGQTASLLATGAGGSSFQWFDVASGGTPLVSTAAYTTAALTTSTTYYVQALNSGCVGPRTAVTVTVNPIPANPTIAGAAICSGNSTTLTATAPGGTYVWWDAPTLGTSINTGIAYNTGTLTTTTTYYVETTVNGCASAGRTPVTVTVNPTPAAPVVNGASICGGNTASLSVTSTGDTYRWYNAASGGDLLTTGTNYTTPALNATTSYYISATSAAGCTGTRTTATVNVTPIQNPAFVYSAGTYCTTGGVNPTPTIPGGNTGTFNSSPAGLVFIDASTGQINAATSTPGLYTITFTTGGSCIYSSSVNIRIIAGNADASFSYNGPFCVQQSNPFPVFTSSSSGGVFTSTAGLSFKNENSGEIDLATSLPGTYTITNTITGSAGCAGDIRTSDVIIRQNTTANAGTNLITCDGQPVTLNGSVGGSATNGSWSIVSGAGTGTFGDATQLSTSFTPTAGQSTVSLQLTSNNPVAPCGVATDIMVIDIRSAPVAPTVNAVTICSGNTATLIASAPGGTYNWYASSSGGISLQTGPTYTTNTLTSSTTYYVAATSADNCVGPRAAVLTTVNPLPAVNSASTGMVCSGVAQNYTFSSSITGSSFTWSRAAVANITNSVVSGQAGTSITETLQSIVTSSVDVVYQIIPTANGCAGAPFNYTVTVKPIPATPTASTTGPVCEGGTIQLSTPLVSGASYNWSGPSTFSSSLREPQIPNAANGNGGTYSVSITVDACVSATGSVIQTIKSTPAAPVVSNSSPVCVGENIQLNTPIVLGASYQWTGPNGFTNTAQEPLINNAGFANAGNYSLAITVDGCTGPSASTAVVVNPLPQAVAISSTGPVCISDQLRVTADALPSATYYWTGPGGFVSTDREFIIPSMTNTTTGTYQVVVSVAGCPSLANSVDATLKPTPSAPNIDPVSPVCENGTLILNAALVTGASYSWSGPSGFVSNTQSPAITSITTAMAGTYAVNIVVDGCRSANNNVNVVVNPLPAAPVLSTGGAACVGNNLQLNAATVSGASYNWFGPSGFSSTNQNPVVSNVSLANGGIYTASVSVNGCAGPTATVTAVVNPLPGPVAINSSGPVCVAEPLSVSAAQVASASYAWTGPNGFVSTNREFVIPSMSSVTVGTYQLIVSVAGCSGSPNLVNATLKPTPSAPAIDPVSPVCENGTLVLNAALVTGATYSWSGPLGFTSNTQSPAITSVTTAMTGTYAVNIIVDGCRSANNNVNVLVNPLPAAPVLSSGGAVCVGNTLQLNAATVSGASYNWSGPAGFSSAIQNPVIPNTSLTNAGTYTAFIRVNGCAGPVSTVTAIVNPLPGPVNINTSGAVCEGRPLQLTADSVTAGVYSWSGPNGFTANTRTVAFASMNNLTAGVYQVAVAVAGCPGTANTINTVLKPTPAAPVINTTAPVCENAPLLLRLNTVTGAIYNWSGPLGFTSNAQNPLIDSVRLNRSGIYTANIIVDGCISNNSSVNISVVPEPAAPTVGSNSPVCVSDQLRFTSNTITGASYRWTGMNGFSSSLQGPVINAANLSDTGRYGLAVTVNGCVSDTSYVQVAVDRPATVNAGNNQVVCANNALVNLAGIVNGGTSTGVWSTGGTGRFGTRTVSLNNTYLPSSLDTATGSVQLTLTSTNNGACRAVVSSLLVQITDAPFVDVGNNPVICANDSLLTVNAQFRNANGIQWSTTGTGAFQSINGANTSYQLSARDQSSNSFRISATTTGNGSCLAVTDEMVVNLALVPVVNAGKDVLVFENTPYTLNPLITGAIQSFQWTPANFLNNALLRNPVFRGNADQLLTLTVVSTNGCVSTDEIFITVLKPFPIPNVFSPNGDGIHDTWVIPELDKYPDAEVSVFDRTGRRVFFTNGYKTPWDGRYEGKPLPLATYYYIIIPKLIQGVFSGPVTILK
ncbi:gliding motility-associated C-terminal domain-containing protein [Sediminibacterium sp.]|uniref:Ig-like domain-containing protein n=1 Tax=Sediminibacterium sp. TaxID=1917865 RepID=UPI0025DCCF07|nr:gliding motility-associated C-terminal domain-containing protein [Sediminibacterium sp.]MBW0178476.1 gliding motility-associated C-terminal domain-containing protein [Sediminibacterium sp.]